MPQARGHLPSLMQLLHYLCSDRLHGYLKTISLDSSAYILKCCASLQGETVKAADLLLRLSSKPGILSRFIVCNPAKSLVHIDRILSSELIDLCDENEIGAASRETLTDLEDPYPADEVAERTVAALDILSQSILLERLKEEDSTLYAGFRKRFFLMEDIVRLDDKSIQKLLREIDYEILARVFSKSSDKLKARIIANMSKRGGMMLQEEIDILGRISDEVYREAAGKLIEMLRRLIGSGEIIL